MSKVVLNKKEQNILKGLSRVISFFAMIGRVFIYIAIVAFIFCMLISPKIIKHVKTYDNTIELKIGDEKMTMVKETNSKVVVYHNDKKESKMENVTSFDNLKKMFDKHSNNTIIGYSEAFLLLMILYLYIISLILKHLGKLFTNINGGETPFTLDNVEHMKKMGIFMIAAIIMPAVISIIFKLFTDVDLDLSLSLIDVVQILFIMSMTLIFKYGYSLQDGSKKTIYDEE